MPKSRRPFSVAAGCLLLAAYFAQLLASFAYAAPPMPPEQLGALLADVIRDAIPPQYEKKQNWDHTKRITSGLEVHGNLFEPRFERRHKEVRHGQWKHYRIDLVDPPRNLQVRVTNLQSLTAGRAAFTLDVASPISGWAQVRNFNRGVHLGTITIEGTSHVRLQISGEVGLGLAPPPAVGLAVDPVITGAHLELAEFDLNRFGELHGDASHELGRGLVKLAEHELDGATLTAKLNRAIAKKRDKLVVDFAQLASGEE